jgi:hypothetical protein
MTEIQLQAKCFQEFWNKYPHLRRCFFHVPNGGSRNKIEASQLKASGVIPGIPDMMLLYNGTIHPMEFKTPTGIISDEQAKVHKAFAAQGITTYIIRSEADFWAAIAAILGNN